ncbi:MAG: hypothetical protein UV56_C0015G0004 [Candidatus Woesebacteria bacterium GW2011_GWC1_43_10b]|uniref:Uncharacterized protein n=3 Tax=Candidatus Woeseibacteriota TaxID=1752722 RepID=A0A0G0PJL0_9BACT|nr:MAG: hypothetical protein UT23_C0004G0103 [Candidatus Woesebacteria bacterium GW2011_GWA1_39_12]KKR01063.1 MAG: hypothetical protein UT24_C0007G0025 [Candidatus Woesebacteria bacterium GW2011_GWB1_39_12]KKS80527.1 MAG: hypothetical protein UV56_C0015G0004 [Candidatus Woesebacteria bacterium GW2011_GWC1_43_10b]
MDPNDTKVKGSTPAMGTPLASDDTGMASGGGPTSTTADEPKMPTGMPTGGMGISVQPTDEPVAPLPGDQPSGGMGGSMGAEPAEETPETTSESTPLGGLPPTKEPEEGTGTGVPPAGGMMGGTV